MLFEQRTRTIFGQPCDPLECGFIVLYMNMHKGGTTNEHLDIYKNKTILNHNAKPIADTCNTRSELSPEKREHSHSANP